MNKVATIHKLATIGLDPSCRGFDYLVEALTMINSACDSITATYADVAKVFGTNSNNVERCIRHLVEAYYSERPDYPTILCLSRFSGRLTCGQFLYKLRVLLQQDTGVTPDGLEWAIMEYKEGRYEVRVFTDKMNVRIYTGDYDACVKFIMKETFNYAAV